MKKEKSNSILMYSRLNRKQSKQKINIAKTFVTLSLLIGLFSCLPLSASALCNHDVVDRNPQLACVTVVNTISKELAVTGNPGFYLKPNGTEETILISGAGNLVQATPNPYSRHDQEKQLSCNFSTAIAKKYQIVITYNLNDYEVLPEEFKGNCSFKVI